MREYYKNEWGELWHGDCLEVMDFLEIVGPVVDMVLCDPPYGTTACAWDSVIPFEKMWPRVWACSKPNAAVVMTASQPFTSTLVCGEMARFKHEWIWIKNRGSNFANTVREPMKEHESALVFSRGGWTYNKQMQERTGGGLGRVQYKFSAVTNTENYGKFTGIPERQSELRVPSSWQKFNTEVGLHPTQKPVALFAYLIQTYTNPGGTVLDFCAGSGTTAVAAEMTGRRWVCIEKEEKYCELIAKRLSARRN